MDNKFEFYLCLFAGPLGFHKFYKKEFGKGLLYLCTFGLFLIGYLSDVVYLYRVAYLGKEDTREQKKEELRTQRQKTIEEERERVAQLDREGVAYCPRCKSTSIQYVERRKQLSIGRAVAGTALINPLAGVVGAVTSKKYKGRIKCLKCGNEWRN